MRWVKQGHVYVADGTLPWAAAYAFPPTPCRLQDDLLRLYVAFCDADTVGRVGYVDVRADEPGTVVGVSEQPVLDIGEPGMFDENGVLPTCVLEVGEELWMYYVGYQLGARVRYYQFQGLAISRDGGASFQRAQRVPVLDRSDAEPLNRTSAFVSRDGDGFDMWYVGGGEWTTVAGKPLPIYNLRHLHSLDGVTWGPLGEVCIDFAGDDEHAFGRPWLWRHHGELLMSYSVRTRTRDYRLGLARCVDGVTWQRCDDEVGIDVSPSGWDAEMIAYASVVSLPAGTCMFYNGNQRGKTGFGWALLDDSAAPLTA